MLPNIPTIGEFVPSYEASSVFGLGGPRNMPAEIIGRLNKEINAGLADLNIKARLAEFGGIVLSTSSAEFGAILADETKKWGEVLRFAGIKAD